MPTQSAVEALKILRDANQFQWHVIPMLAFVLYVYNTEIEKGNWNTVFAGLAFWGMDWFNEIWNALVFHFTNYAPIWGAPGKTAYLILIGLNIEICFMFSIAGIVMTKILPKDRNQKIFGAPNRLFIALAGSVGCVIVEMILNSANALTWDYSWWSIRFPWLILLVGYLPFYLVSFFVHDLKTIKQKLAVTSAIFAIDAAGLILFAGILKWI